jgi:nitrogen fixation/metabolism regulation signal transduction histidine kinase
MRVRAGEALHELRRPLHAMALAGGDGATARRLEVATGARAEQHRRIAGAPPQLALRSVELRPLVEAAVECRCGEDGSAVQMRWLAGDARAVLDPRRFAQALDNLIANALEHGGSPVTVEAAQSSAGLRISVRNPLRDMDLHDSWPPLANGLAGTRGHGLRIVSTIAGEHGGRFLFDCSAGWAVGVIELPFAERAMGSVLAT